MCCEVINWSRYNRFNLPKIYIMVKQLSNAKPKRKRHAANSQNELENAVAIPVTHPIRFAPTNAGIRPYLSAM